MKRECRERHSFFVPKSFTISLSFPKKEQNALHCDMIFDRIRKIRELFRMVSV